MNNPLFVNSRPRYQRNTWLHIKRQLPTNKMKINVAIKKEVQPSDILGEGQTPTGFRIIHIAKELGVDPKTAPSCLRRKVGQYIYKGELIAMSQGVLGLNRKIYISKVDGILDDYNQTTGDMRIKLIPKNNQVLSGVYGIVEEIDSAQGIITIKTVGSIIRGVLGVGIEREGIIEILGSADSLISSRQIPQEVKGKILVGGGLIFPEALEQLRGCGAAGIITGGINASDYKTMVGGRWNIRNKRWTDVGMTLLVTEGFDDCPIGDDIMALLKEHNNKFAIMDGNSGRLILPSQDRNCMMYLRRVSLPGDASEVPEQQIVELKIGDNIRIISSPYIGIQGKVVVIDQTATKLPSGITVPMVTVDTKSKKIKVPYLNIEVLR